MSFVLKKLRHTAKLQLETIQAIDKEIEDARIRLLKLAVQRDKYLIAYSETQAMINRLEKGEMSIE